MLIGACGVARAGGERPVVVELYTSQSCGPCVPADNLLTSLAKRSDVVALTLTVNYWDILGWKDTLAIDASAVRQKAYARSMRRGGVYTPQVIVDGRIDLVGNREDSVYAAIDDAQKKMKACAAANEKKGGGCFVPVSATRSADGGLNVELPSAGGHKVDAMVWLFAVRRGMDVRIGGGENKGRTLHYSNVVRDIRAIGKWNGSATALRLTADEVKLSADEDAVVLLQKNPAGPILGAAVLAGLRTGRKR